MPSGSRVVGRPERIAQAQAQIAVDVRPGAVVERVVGRDRSVGVDPRELAARAGQRLRGRRLEMLAGRDVQLAVVAEVQRTAMMLSVGSLAGSCRGRFAAGDRAGEIRLGGEPGQRGRGSASPACRTRSSSGWSRSPDPTPGPSVPAARSGCRCWSATGTASASPATCRRCTLRIVPPSSSTSMSPFGRNLTAMGRSRPDTSTSFWNTPAEPVGVVLKTKSPDTTRWPPESTDLTR